MRLKFLAVDQLLLLENLVLGEVTVMTATSGLRPMVLGKVRHCTVRWSVIFGMDQMVGFFTQGVHQYLEVTFNLLKQKHATPH